MIDLNGAYPSIANWAELVRRFFTSRYVLHLENEVEHLRGQIDRLTMQLEMASKPPARKVEFPKFTPTRTSWESYLAEQIALQDKEEPSAVQK